MRFQQLDQITRLEPGKYLEATKRLSPAEGYLRDHFPRFPVMPGVLMLEAMVQAGNWLVRATDRFAHAVVVLQEARAVKFSGFVRPGDTLTVTVDVKKQYDRQTTLVARASVDGKTVAGARLILERFQLADRYPPRAATDPFMRDRMRSKLERLVSPEPDDRPDPPLTMRWMWIDRIVEFVRGDRAVAVKNVSMTEEPLDEYLPGFPVLPCSLIIEGIALTGGILASDLDNCEKGMVLAKIGKAVFHRPALPGDQLTYTAEIDDIEPEGAFIRGTSHIGGELQAEVQLLLAHLDERFLDVDLIDSSDSLRLLRLLGLYDVGRKLDGSPIDAPPHFQKVEQQALAALRT